MKFRRQNNLKRVAVSMTTKSILQLETISKRMGLDMSNALSRLLQEFITDKETRLSFLDYETGLQQGGFWFEKESRKLANYMVPRDVLNHPMVQEEIQAHNLSRFIRTLVYFNHFSKVVSTCIDFEGEIVGKIRDAGLNVISYSHFDHVLIIRVDTGHLNYISIPAA